jgi:hypothetical protein
VLKSRQELEGFRMKSFAFAAAFCIFCLASPVWSDVNIVQNPSFETGDFTDWTVNESAGDPWNVFTSRAGVVPFAGDAYFASTGCPGAICISGTASQQASLSQTLATTPGQIYNLTFELVTNAGPPDELQVLWNGSVALDLGPGGTLGDVTSYTLYGAAGLTATSASTTLTFLGREDPGRFGLDNVSVVPVGNVTPEPGSYAALILGFGGVMLVVRSGRAKQRE